MWEIHMNINYYYIQLFYFLALLTAQKVIVKKLNEELALGKDNLISLSILSVTSGLLQVKSSMYRLKFFVSLQSLPSAFNTGWQSYKCKYKKVHSFNNYSGTEKNNTSDCRTMISVMKIYGFNIYNFFASSSSFFCCYIHSYINIVHVH